ncbi:MAG: hypothetical protein U9R02_08735 [Thermodesulfobacteriota bacterium]|nr:hypothetical protein [Thermodesulfobacteriota bacterium]
MKKIEGEKKRLRPKQPMPEFLEKRILVAMDRCKKVVDTMKSNRQVEPKKLHQPFDL